MLIQIASKIVLAIGMIFSATVTLAAIPTPPDVLCYQNCINEGYGHNYCVELCKKRPTPPGRNPRIPNSNCEQSYILDFGNAETQTVSACQQAR